METITIYEDEEQKIEILKGFINACVYMKKSQYKLTNEEANRVNERFLIRLREKMDINGIKLVTSKIIPVIDGNVSQNYAEPYDVLNDVFYYLKLYVNPEAGLEELYGDDEEIPLVDEITQENILEMIEINNSFPFNKEKCYLFFDNEDKTVSGYAAAAEKNGNKVYMLPFIITQENLLDSFI